RAKKARYYEDPQLQARILPPPAPSVLQGVNDEAGATRREHDNPWGGARGPAAQQAEDPDNAGIRREPELPEQEEVVLEPRTPVREFELSDDDPPAPSQALQAFQRRTRRLARPGAGRKG